MIKEAVYHINTENYIYPIARNQLVVKIRVAKKDIIECELIFWNRTTPDVKEKVEMRCRERDQLFDYYQVTISFPKVARYQKYYFRLTDTKGKEYFYTSVGLKEAVPESNFFEFLYANKNDVLRIPEWSKGMIYYQIFPERFCNGDKTNDPENCEAWGTEPTRTNFMGGDLEGIRSKIPYLNELGIECIYLNPIFKGEFNHKYATTDYFSIDPIFGTKEDFRLLVEECHQNGIRIVLDGVFNHTGIDFAPFYDVRKEGANSSYKDWFFVNNYPISISHHDYECVGAYKYMPKLNTANAEVRKYILDIMDYWIREFNIDGWRLDVADEVDATVWQEARAVLKEKYPECLLLGETWGFGGKMLLGNQMDTVMNYMFCDTMRDYFAYESIPVEELDHRINRMLALYRDEITQGLYNLLDSHDTERFLFCCGENKSKFLLAVAFQMTFVGAPAIYYGDEAGMTGDNDPDCRRCMIWDDHTDENVLNWYKELIQLRKQYKALRYGDFHTVVVDKINEVYGFVRIFEEEAIYIIFHRGNETRDIDCPVIGESLLYKDIFGNNSCSYSKQEKEHQCLNEDIVEYGGVIKVKMEPYSVKVIKN